MNSGRPSRDGRRQTGLGAHEGRCISYFADFLFRSATWRAVLWRSSVDETGAYITALLMSDAPQEEKSSPKKADQEPEPGAVKRHFDAAKDIGLFFKIHGRNHSEVAADKGQSYPSQ